MDGITFSWDEKKDRSNQLKHKISFNEARTVFADDYARLISDPEHSQNEERFLILGRSTHARLLMVCHCYKEQGERIRIISARKASKQETKQYKEFKNA